MNKEDLDDMSIEEMQQAYEKIQEKIREEAGDGSPA